MRRTRITGVRNGMVAPAVAVVVVAAACAGRPQRPADGPDASETPRLVRHVTLRLPTGLATERFTIEARADLAYDVWIVAPAGSAVEPGTTVEISIVFLRSPTSPGDAIVFRQFKALQLGESVGRALDLCDEAAREAGEPSEGCAVRLHPRRAEGTALRLLRTTLPRRRSPME